MGAVQVMKSIVEPSGAGLAGLARQILTSNEGRAYRYLRRMWLTSAAGALREARRKAGLSQAELATKLGTTQSAVARLENDTEGRLSLHRYVDYALACGQFPLEITIEPASAVRAYAIHEPDAPRTQTCLEKWRTEGLTGLNEARRSCDSSELGAAWWFERLSPTLFPQITSAADSVLAEQSSNVYLPSPTVGSKGRAPIFDRREVLAA
jgi:transcriptional regulator with XRE-family HTH domain